MKNQKLKIFLATGLAIFNLFVCFAGCVAWFTAAKINNASDMQIQMYTHELDLSYRVYRYSDDEKSPIDATDRADAFELPKYDSVIKSRNEHTPVIIEFLISGMSLNDLNPIYLETYCTNLTTTARTLSNIVELKFGLQVLDRTSVPNIYNTSVEFFQNKTARIFRDSNDSSIKINNILYEATDYSEYLVDGQIALYMQLDYSETLIDAFEFSLADATTTSFANDLTLINCYTDRES